MIEYSSKCTTCYSSSTLSALGTWKSTSKCWNALLSTKSRAIASTAPDWCQNKILYLLYICRSQRYLTYTNHLSCISSEWSDVWFWCRPSSVWSLVEEQDLPRQKEFHNICRVPETSVNETHHVHQGPFVIVKVQKNASHFVRYWIIPELLQQHGCSWFTITVWT